MEHLNNLYEQNNNEHIFHHLKFKQQKNDLIVKLEFAKLHNFRFNIL